MFRVFATNPDLLAKLRPATHARFLRDGFVPVVAVDWRQAMAGAPERTLMAAAGKIEAATRRAAREPQARKWETASPSNAQSDLFAKPGM
ncbi:MAG: hypothetical protein ING19_06805 [Azospirillum sp.]|nr:hypothetical protein [Azospirillum sp.]